MPTVGAMFVGSFGYDQTNIEAFQVIERRGKKSVRLQRVHVRPAGVRPYDGHCGEVAPVRDYFDMSHYGVTRVVKFYGKKPNALPYIRIGDVMTLFYASDGTTFYRSSYA
jgi:hypothetical protein